jgi:SNF family Na+-dependent transporter
MTGSTSNLLQKEKNGETIPAPSEFDMSIGELEESSSENSRDQWSGRLDFLLSCIGYAVGLGNIWRFPYLCYRNGGAVFLIPYLIFMVICAMPLFFLEVSIGQFASLSPLTVWRVSPLFTGIGYGMVIVSGIVCIYYNVVMAWTIYYFFKSLHTVLPWSTCDNEWNTPSCSMHGIVEVNETFNTNATLNGTFNGTLTYTESYPNATNVTLKRTSPSEEFWEREVLQISSGIEDLNGIRWELLGCLALAWLIVFFCLFKGVKSSGKVVYVTATFPYIFLLILLLRGVTLPGAIDGIRFFLVPEWHKLLSVNVWAEAAMQIFFSVGTAFGALITLASYNNFHHDCYKDARFVPILNCATSIFAGFVLFSIIGFLAHSTGTKVEEVITQGPGLVFVVYPGAIANMPFAQLWAVLFFLMLFTVGIDTQFFLCETVTSAIIDQFPRHLREHQMFVTAGICFVAFLVGIPCVTRGGVYVLQIMDWYSSAFSLMVLCLMECIVVAYTYGVNRFYKDIELMLGYQLCLWWKLCWYCVTPITIMFVFWFSIRYHVPVTYGDYEYPGWALALGWMFAMCSIVPLPLVASIKFIWTEGRYLDRLRSLIRPTKEWGPALDEHRDMYIASMDISDTMVIASLKTSDEETHLVG